MNEGKNLTSMEETSTPEPVLLAVDDDPNTLGRIEHELRQRYGSYYRVACEGSPEAGMRTLQDLRAADKDVAVVLADQWMPGMTGVEFLTHTRSLYPGAKRALLFERGNRTTREPILQAMALDGLLDTDEHRRLEDIRARAELDHQHAKPEVDRLHLIVRLPGTQASEGIG
jgi:DNA-binding NarL/FixJ family response regulator